MQIRVVKLGIAAIRGSKIAQRLKTDERPIANKYHEGKMKRTLKRELKVLEIVGREAVGGSGVLGFMRSFGANINASTGQHGLAPWEICRGDDWRWQKVPNRPV